MSSRVRSDVQISFVVTSRNEPPHLLDATLRGLRRTCGAHRCQIIVVDDASEVPVASAMSGVTLLRNDGPRGVSSSRRRGCEAASGEVFIVLDAHLSFADDWLEALLDVIDERSVYCAASWDYELTAPRFFGANIRWEPSPWRGLTFEPRRAEPAEAIVDVPMVLGACYAVTRSGYDALGGFSPVFRLWGCDEQDLSLRAHLAGLSVRCATRARVGHLDGRSQNYLRPPEYVIHNVHALLRTLWEPPTTELLEASLPAPPRQVERWLQEPAVQSWRATVQSTRVRTDIEVLTKVLPDGPFDVSGAQVRWAQGAPVTDRRRLEAAVRAESYPDAAPVDRVLPPTEPAAPGFVVDCLGTTLCVTAHAAREALLHALPGACAVQAAAVDVDATLELASAGQHGFADALGLHVLLADGEKVAVSTELPELLARVDGVVAGLVAEHSTGIALLRAGVVETEGRTLLLLGDELDGLPGLLAALQQAGALVSSRAFAGVDEQGRVRSWDGDAQAREVSAVLRVRLQPEATGCTLQPLRPAPAVMALVEHSVAADGDRELMLRCFHALVQVPSLVYAAGFRGAAHDAAGEILRMVERLPGRHFPPDHRGDHGHIFR